MKKKTCKNCKGWVPPYDCKITGEKTYTPRLWNYCGKWEAKTGAIPMTVRKGE